MPHEAGIWFPRFKKMFTHCEASHQPHWLFSVCWDRNSQGSKVFGLFEGASQYFRVVQQMFPGSVCGYELLLENRPCKLYLDAEWETSGGGADTAASQASSAEEAEAHLLVSLITVFDRTLPLVCYKDAVTQKTYSSNVAAKKRRAVHVGTAADTGAPKKAKLATPP